MDTVAAITAAGGRASSTPVDVADDDSVRAAVQHTVDTHGGLHVLYNNAGISPGDDDGPTTTSDDTWSRRPRRQRDRHRPLLPLGHSGNARSGGGSIVNVASFVAHIGAATPQIAVHRLEGSGPRE